jgi:hypothetical protein
MINVEVEEDIQVSAPAPLIDPQTGLEMEVEDSDDEDDIVIEMEIVEDDAFIAAPQLAPVVALEVEVGDTVEIEVGAKVEDDAFFASPQLSPVVALEVEVGDTVEIEVGAGVEQEAGGHVDDGGDWSDQVKSARGCGLCTLVLMVVTGVAIVVGVLMIVGVYVEIFGKLLEWWVAASFGIGIPVLMVCATVTVFCIWVKRKGQAEEAMDIAECNAGGLEVGGSISVPLAVEVKGGVEVEIEVQA